MDLIEAYAIAPVVPITGSKAQRASRKSIGDNLGDLSDLIVFRRRADVEDLIVNEISRRLQRASDCMRNVPHVHQRTPLSTITGHLYLLHRPGQAGEIIQDDIKAHAWRSSVGGRVAQKG